MHDAHNALRGPKTPPPGVRPGSLAEPRPQRSDRTARCSSGDTLPTLALPALAGSAGEAVDSSALRFLTALAGQEEEGGEGAGEGEGGEEADEGLAGTAHGRGSA